MSDTEIQARKNAVLMLLLTAVLWSLGGLLIKMVPWSPLAVAGARSAIAAVVLRLAIRKPSFTWSVPQIGAAVAYALTVSSFVAANQLTTAANAICLQYTSLIYIALLGPWFLGERSSRRDWLTIAAILTGMVLFLFDGLVSGSWLGDLCAAFSGLCFGSMALLLRKQKGGSPVESIYLGNLLTAFCGLPFILREQVDTASLLPILALGIFQLGIPYLLYTRAIRHVTALEAMLIPVLEPILNPLWVLLLLGERPSLLSLFGGVLVIGSVALHQVLVLRRQIPPSA
jgi:drug/metabolite transporter (DMT)-like permease